MRIAHRFSRGLAGGLLGLVVTLCLSGGALAQSQAKIAEITTTDGSTFRGELVRQSPAEVVIRVSGIETRFDQDDVKSIEIRDSPREVYRERREKLDDDDLNGRLELARDMYDMQALDVARQELNALDRDFPDQAKVAELINLIEAQQRLSNTRSTREAFRNPDNRPGSESGNPGRDQFLSEDQINLIRVYELDLSTEPRIVIPSEAIDQLFERFNSSPLVPRGRRERIEFRRRPGYEQADLLFKLRARDLYSQIDVREEPGPLADYRRFVNDPYVARYFGPLFGQGQIDGLTLFTDRPGNEVEAYTNFYLLSQFTRDGKLMIDRANPEMSLLLQWALPRDVARWAAPEVENWTPRFQSMQDPEFVRIVEWVQSLYDGEPDYGIDYSPGSR